VLRTPKKEEFDSFRYLRIKPMRIKIVILISAAILLFDIAACANSDKSTSIALITDKALGLDKSLLVSLLEAELSQKDGIQLLERAAIDKILDEQKLSAAGLLDRNATIKIGKLLRADAFIILSLENKTQDANDLIRIRVSETAHGLRLLDYFEQSNSKNPKEAVERIIKKLEVVFKKINQTDEKLIPIGIVDIHRVQLGEQYKMLERTLPVMLSVRLSLEPQIIMLEREDLKVLLDEKLRTEGEDSKFWNSAVLIEGYLQPNSGHLEMHLNLKQAAGAELKSLTIPFEPNEPAAAIAKATTEIIQQLQNSPPITKWQPELEAEQFYKQGQMLTAHSRYEEAVPLYETAHALQPKNLFYIGAAFSNEWTNRFEHTDVYYPEYWNGVEISSPSYVKNWEPCYTDLELANLVSIVVRHMRDNYRKGVISTRDIYDKFARYLGDDRYSGGYFINKVSFATEQIAQINQENRKIWVDTFSDALKKQVIKDDYPPMNNLIRARLVWLGSNDSNELMINVKKAFNEFVMPPELGGIVRLPAERELIYEQTFGTLEFFSQEELKELADINDPYISAISKIALIRISTNTYNEKKGAMTEESLIETIKILLRELKSLGESQNNQIKKHRFLYELRKTIKSQYISLDNQITNLEELCNLLIEQKDFDNLILLNPIYYKPIDFNMYFILKPTLYSNNERKMDLCRRYYLLLDRIAKVLNNHANDKKVLAFINSIRDNQYQMKNLFPELVVSQKSSILSVKILLNQNDWVHKINVFNPGESQVVSKDKILWIAVPSGQNTGHKDVSGTTIWPTDIVLACVNLSEEKIISTWQTTITPPNPLRGLGGLIITDKVCYISLMHVGILEFPGSITKGRSFLNEPKVLTKDNDLHSSYITSIAQCGDRLWVAYGDKDQESGLGIYDPNTGQWETVFCSTIKGDSLFNRGKPYAIHSMQLVSSDDLFFLVHDPSNPKDESKDNPEGLWKINTKTRETKYFGPLYLDRKDRINVEYIDKNIWFKSWFFIIKYNPDSEIFTKIAGDTNYLQRLYLEKNIPLKLEREPFVPESFSTKIIFGPYYSQGNLDLSTCAIHNNKLWARLGQSQILIVEKGKSFEDAQIIDNNILEGGPVYKFVSTPYGLIGIGEGTVGLIETEIVEK
jgi:hypothetical protein